MIQRPGHLVVFGARHLLRSCDARATVMLRACGRGLVAILRARCPGTRKER